MNESLFLEHAKINKQLELDMKLARARFNTALAQLRINQCIRLLKDAKQNYYRVQDNAMLNLGD